MGISRAGSAAALAARAAIVTVAAATVATIALAVPAAAPRAGGTIVGVVTTAAKNPPPLRVTIDPDVCGQTLPDDSIAVDAAGHLAGVVLTVPGVKAAAPAEAPVTNDKCRFAPRVSLVRPNGTVAMTSKDSVLHTMHAAAADTRSLFNVSLPIPNMKISRPIDKPGVVTLTCSTHTWMRAYLFVTEELSAVSGADGSFKLDNVPAGSYDIKVWHEALKAAVPTRVVVKDGETVTLNVTMK
ncbi:MAG TPA: carboxypeptidase regulatory-like domain-containing protein [Vicinamibacterales bacterium]|nr:carboxypeptidase regulatory-like domain-containing protein [Vicinamibacterales bacterium]